MFLLRKLSDIDSKAPIPPGSKTAQPNQSTMSRMVKSMKSTSMVGMDFDRFIKNTINIKNYSNNTYKLNFFKKYQEMYYLC